MRWMLVFLGGGLGSLARWGLQSAATRWTEGVFPFGTLVANLGGSFLLGLLAGLASAVPVKPELKLLLATGFLGGFTTFSTWQLESWGLFTSGQIHPALWNLVGSPLLGLCALGMGWVLGERL